MIFTRDGAAFLPTEHAVGPWQAGQLHGGAPSALLGEAVQALAPEMQVARITFEFLGPVPLAPLAVAARIVKPGRRFQLAEGEVTAGGRPVLLVRAALLRRGDPVALPPHATWPDGLPCAGPEAATAIGFPGSATDGATGFHRTGMELRFAPGSDYGRGEARTWFRLAGPLIDGEQPTALARALTAADFGNGVSAALDFGTHLFVNTDLTVTLLRDPVGEWVLLDARTRIDPHGIGWAASTLHDQRGPLGFAQQTLLVAPRSAPR